MILALTKYCTHGHFHHFWLTTMMENWPIVNNLVGPRHGPMWEETFEMPKLSLTQFSYDPLSIIDNYLFFTFSME